MAPAGGFGPAKTPTPRLIRQPVPGSLAFDAVQPAIAVLVEALHDPPLFHHGHHREDPHGRALRSAQSAPAAT